MAKKVSVKWLGKPEDHDYPAALSYLSLIYDPATATGMVRMADVRARVQRAELDSRKGKTVLQIRCAALRRGNPR